MLSDCDKIVSSIIKKAWCRSFQESDSDDGSPVIPDYFHCSLLLLLLLLFFVIIYCYFELTSLYF